MTEAKSRQETISDLMGDFSLLFTFVRSLWHEHLETLHPDLTRGVLPTLLTIARTQPVTATDIACSLSADKTIISKQVSHLRQLGLIEATVSKDDGRVFFLSISEEGKRLIALARQKFAKDYETRFEGWSDEEISSLQTALHSFLTAQ